MRMHGQRISFMMGMVVGNLSFYQIIEHASMHACMHAGGLVLVQSPGITGDIQKGILFLFLHHCIMSRKTNNQDTVGAFCSWMELAGIEYTHEAIDIVGTSPGTLSIVAVDDIPEQYIIATIPKQSCITVLTTELSDILREEGLAGGLGLVIAVWFEKGIGKASIWAGYFESLQDKENLPIFWSMEERELLQGTEIDPSDVQEDYNDVMDDYVAHVVPLLKKYPDVFSQMSDTNVESFLEAASLVASRAFGVDDVHGDGMVPLADVFNHKVSVVELSEEYTIHGAESDSLGVPDSCRSSPCSSSGSEGSLCFPQPCAEKPGEMLERCGMTHANGLNLKLQIAIIDDDRNECLQIMSASSLTKGEEVFNTYGELGNAELVKKYGFCVSENPFTCVTLDKMTFVSALQELLALEKPRKRAKGIADSLQRFQEVCDAIRDQTHLLSEKPGEEPFLIYPGGHVNSPVYVFVFLTILGICDENRISDVKRAVLLNRDLIQAAEDPRPVSLERVVKESCLHELASCSNQRATEIAKECMKALGTSARKRREVSQKARDIQANIESGPSVVVSTLRSSELCILDTCIDLTDALS